MFSFFFSLLKQRNRVELTGEKLTREMLERNRILLTGKDNYLFHDQLRWSGSLVRVKAQDMSLRGALKFSKEEPKLLSKVTEIRSKMSQVKNYWAAAADCTDPAKVKARDLHGKKKLLHQLEEPKVGLSQL